MNETILKKIRDGGFCLDALLEDYPEIRMLEGTPQNPEYHAEGDVYCHTRLVCQKLLLHPEWQSLQERQQELLFLAAVFHDIGKPSVTKLQDGKWTSPKHALVGEKVFRGLVYRENDKYGLTWEQREMAAKLIRYHGLPVWFWTKRRPEFELLKAAESIPLRLLHLLSAADAKGRQGSSIERLLEHVELFADYAKELGVWEMPYAFADSYTRFQYYRKNDLWCGAKLYDDTEFDVYLMSGLPLAGKDTWIQKQGPDIEVISLDEIRKKLGISPVKSSDKVVQAAMEQVRKLLRRKQPFIWNATNIIQETRQKLISLFADYGARVHLIYVEAPYKELYERNQKRERYIPETVLEQMIRKLEIPAPWEAYEVKVVKTDR